jgi:hypothetical protein
MAWPYRKNARQRNSKKNVRKAVRNKTKTKNEVAGRRVHGPKIGVNEWRQSKGSRDPETYRRGQGPSRAVVPFKKCIRTYVYV